MGKKILEFAKTFLGMTYDKDKNIIFVTEYYGKKKYEKVPYCCIFVWYVFRMLGLSSCFYGGNKTASCTTLLKYCKSNSKIVVHKDIDRCIPGRTLIFYNFRNNGKANHVGIFDSKISASRFYSVEGNTSNNLLGSQDNGGYVMRKNRPLSKVMAFATLEEKSKCPYSIPSETVSRGTRGNDAGWVQWQLNRKSYYCEIDESFGKSSCATLAKFQKANGLEPDERCGPATRNKLSE